MARKTLRTRTSKYAVYVADGAAGTEEESFNENGDRAFPVTAASGRNSKRLTTVVSHLSLLFTFKWKLKRNSACPRILTPDCSVVLPSLIRALFVSRS